MNNGKQVTVKMKDGSVKKGVCVEYGQYGFTFQTAQGAVIERIKLDDCDGLEWAKDEAVADVVDGEPMDAMEDKRPKKKGSK